MDNHFIRLGSKSKPAPQEDRQVNEASGEFIIDLRNVTKQYKSSAGPFTALRDIDFQVKRGEFVAVVGKSGSGKSTLLNILGGIDSPTAGEVIMGRTAVPTLNQNQLANWRGKYVGVVFQFFQLLPT